MILFLIISVIILNLVDWYFTSKGIKEGIFSELNPFVRWLWKQGKLKVILFKFLSLSIFTIIIWLFRETQIAKIGADLVALMYTIILGLHLEYRRKYFDELNQLK